MDKYNSNIYLDSNDKDKLRDGLHRLLLNGRIECSHLIKKVKKKGKRRGK